MAFYHIGNCDCPIGCCDCGETTSTIHVKYSAKKDEIYEHWTDSILADEIPEKVVYLGTLEGDDYECECCSQRTYVRPRKKSERC